MAGFAGFSIRPLGVIVPAAAATTAGSDRQRVGLGRRCAGEHPGIAAATAATAAVTRGFGSAAATAANFDVEGVAGVTLTEISSASPPPPPSPPALLFPRRRRRRRRPRP